MDPTSPPWPHQTLRESPIPPEYAASPPDLTQTLPQTPPDHLILLWSPPYLNASLHPSPPNPFAH